MEGAEGRLDGGLTLDGVAAFEGGVQACDWTGHVAHSEIRLRSTSESGAVGASRSLSEARIRVLSVFGVYSVSGVGWRVVVA